MLFRTPHPELDMYVLFKKWLSLSKSGERFVYYTGNSLSESIIGTVLANNLMKHAMSGDIYLFQRKIRNFVYEHIAIKANNPPLKFLIPINKKPISAAKMGYISNNRLNEIQMENRKGIEIYG